MRRKWLIAGMGAIFLIALIARIIPGARTIDDAYITFRYARNILAGDGFAYNPGERVLGTSSPLYTLAMTAIGFFSQGAKSDFVSISWGLNALLDGVSAILLILIGQRLDTKWAGWGAGLAWAVAPFSVTFAIGGMETSLYVMLLCLTFWASLERRYRLAALAGALSLLTRPDALILLFGLGLYRLYAANRGDGGRIRPGEIGALLLPIVIWVSFAMLYFGSPIPHSLLAKSEAYSLVPQTALIRFMQHYASPFQGHLSFGLGWIGVGLILYPSLAIIGVRRALKQDAVNLAFGLFPWIYFLAFTLANPLIFRWYLTSPLPFYFLYILIGLESVLDNLPRLKFSGKFSSRWTSKILKLGVIVVLPFSLLLADWELRPSHGPPRPAPSMAWIALELQYQEAAAVIIDRLGGDLSNIRLAAGDVGVLGYVSNLPILDLVGLNSAESLEYYPLEAEAYNSFVYAIPDDLILNEEPDYLVILEIYGRETILKNAEFQKEYQSIFTIESDIYGSENMLLFERVAE